MSYPTSGSYTYNAAKDREAIQKARDILGTSDVTFEELNDRVESSVKTASTINAAVSLVESGKIPVGSAVNTLEYHTGTGVGGGSYQLIDAGDAGSRPSEDGGKVVHAGSDGLYLSFVGNLPSPEQYGVLTDGTDSTAEFKSWIANNAALYCHSVSGGKKIYTVTDFDLNLPHHKLVAIGNVEIHTSSEGVTLSGDNASMSGVTIIHSNSATDGVTTQGFANVLDSVFVTGSSNNACLIDGLETRVSGGKYKGGTVAAMNVSAADSILENVYLEQSGTGLLSNGVGTITAYNVHSFGNTGKGFYITGANGSKLTDCFADTNGTNGLEIADTSGIDIVNFTAIKSGELVANSANIQFFNTTNAKLIGGRTELEGDEGVDDSIRFSGTGNQIDIIGHSADKTPSDFTGNVVTFSACTDALQKYSKGSDSIVAFGGNALPSTVFPVTIPIKTDASASTGSFGFKSIDVRVAYRNLGATNAGVFDYTLLITDMPVSKVIVRSNGTPFIELSNPAISTIVEGVGDLTFDLLNTDASVTYRVSFEIRESITANGFS